VYVLVKAPNICIWLVTRSLGMWQSSDNSFQSEFDAGNIRLSGACLCQSHILEQSSQMEWLSVTTSNHDALLMLFEQRCLHCTCVLSC
jgi:hypothetical protein